MPGVEPLIKAINPVLLADRPENIPLWLPSALSPTSRKTLCIDDLAELEYRFRHALALKSLQDIQRYCRLRQLLVEKARSHIANTQKTRTRVLQDKVNTQLRQAVATYRASQTAIADLAPNEEYGSWKAVLKKLEDSHVRAPGVVDPGGSRSRFVDSWIWKTAPQLSASTNDPDLQAVLRAEWCKAQQRAKRHEEEKELVAEEMRRTLVTFEQDALEWEAFATKFPAGASDMDRGAIGGCVAYAHKQASIRRKMIKVFIADWYHLLEKLPPSTVSWLKNYPRPPEPKRIHRLASNVPLCHPGSPAAQSDDEVIADKATKDVDTHDVADGRHTVVNDPEVYALVANDPSLLEI